MSSDPKGIGSLNETMRLVGQVPLWAMQDYLHRFCVQIKRMKLPIFIKLVALTTLLIIVVICSISFSMLSKQKEQFTDQLINLGKGMARIAAGNAADKLLGEEDLALFQLVNDIAQDDQVLYALITDEKDSIKAHSNIDAVNERYQPPEDMKLVQQNHVLKVSSFVHRGQDALFLERPITYQNLRVGQVRLAISKNKISESTRDAKLFVLELTVIIILLGVLLSVGLGLYISRPIHKLMESTEALGMGDFDHRVSIRRNDELGDLGRAFNKMAEDLALKEKIQDSFGLYVTPEIVELLLENPDNPWMKGSKVEASILFVDIRGFTALSEDEEPEEVVEVLNDYFTRVTDIVINHGGHLNKFLGDAAMAVFGTPVPIDQHAEKAVMAALDIQGEIRRLYKQKETDNLVYRVGVGINSGEVVAGSLGSRKRLEYTVVGDNVNVASRLTSLAKPGEILISKRTCELIGEKPGLRIEERGKIPVKGRRTGITVFNVMSLDEDQHEEINKPEAS